MKLGLVLDESRKMADSSDVVTPPLVLELQIVGKTQSPGLLQICIGAYLHISEIFLTSKAL